MAHEFAHNRRSRGERCVRRNASSPAAAQHSGYAVWCACAWRVVDLLWCATCFAICHDTIPPRSSHQQMRHVALLIETSGSYGRGLLRGIAKYNRAYGGWSTYFRPHGLADSPPKWLRKWEGDG